MTWASKYIGLPFAMRGRGPDQFDCWGLCSYVLRQECGLEVEPFADIGTFDSIAVEDRVRTEIARTDWIAVPRADVRPFDVAVMWAIHGKRPKTLSHLGIVERRERLLHIERERRTECIKFSNPLVAGRLHSFYRHRAFT